MRTTKNLDIKYYVKDNFNVEQYGSIHRLESSVEEEHMQNLRYSCNQERSYRKCALLVLNYKTCCFKTGSCHKRRKAQAPTPQAPIRNHRNEKSRKRQSS